MASTLTAISLRAGGALAGTGTERAPLAPQRTALAGVGDLFREPCSEVRRTRPRQAPLGLLEREHRSP